MRILERRKEKTKEKTNRFMPMLNKYLFTKRDAKTQPKKPGYMGHHKTDYVANDRKSINNPNKHMGCMRICSAQ